MNWFPSISENQIFAFQKNLSERENICLFEYIFLPAYQVQPFLEGSRVKSNKSNKSNIDKHLNLYYIMRVCRNYSILRQIIPTLYFETFEKLGNFHHPQKDDGLF
jgi:hypothetical protein